MTKSSDTARALAGIGVGLRLEFASALVADADAPIAFVEVHPENFVCRGGAHATMLAVARARFPIITHGLTFGFANEEAPTRSFSRGLEAIRGPRWLAAAQRPPLLHLHGGAIHARTPSSCVR